MRAETRTPRSPAESDHATVPWWLLGPLWLVGMAVYAWDNLPGRRVHPL